MKFWGTIADFIANGKSNSLPVGTVLELEGDLVAGDNSGTKWKLTSSSGTSSTRVNKSTFNDASGKQWKLVCGKTTTLDAFTDLETLQPEDGDFPKRFVCVERANAEYLLQPAIYIPLVGDVTFANGRVAELQIDGEVNAMNFGPHSVNVDFTQPIKDAIARTAIQSTALVGSDNRIIYSPVKCKLPAGAYLVSDEIVIDKNFVALVGDGSGLTVIYRINGDYGDTIRLSPVDPSATRLIGSSVSGIKFDCRAEMNSGSHLSLVSVSQANFDDMMFENGFKSLHIKGVQSCNITNTIAKSGRYFAATKVGSRFLHIDEGHFENTEVFFDNFNWTFTINATIEAAIEINEMDGVWFDNGHVLGGATELLVNGNLSSQCMGGRFNNVWFDGFCERSIVFTGAATGSFKDFEFNSCKSSGFSSLFLEVESGCNVNNVKFNGHEIANANGNGAILRGGDNYSFAGGGFSDIARAGSSNQYFINVASGSGVTSLNVNAMPMIATTIDYGIRILDSGCKANINDVYFSGVQVKEVDIPSSGFGGRVLGCITDRVSSNSAASASTISANAVSSVINVTGTTQTINTIHGGWDGRVITLRGATASHTLAHGGGNILTNGNVNITLNSNRGRRLTYSSDAAAWYDA